MPLDRMRKTLPGHILQTSHNGYAITKNEGFRMSYSLWKLISVRKGWNRLQTHKELGSEDNYFSLISIFNRHVYGE